MKRIIVGMTGADGVTLGVRLLQLLQGMDAVETHLVMTPQAERNLILEGECSPAQARGLAHVSYSADDMEAPISSGSYTAAGMIIAPCSMKSLAALVCGYTENLLQRAADVCLKERRTVVLIPREMPLGKVHLRNLCTAADLGCVIVPPVLTFYNRPQSVQDHIDHILAKALLPFGITLPNFRAWKDG